MKKTNKYNSIRVKPLSFFLTAMFFVAVNSMVAQQLNYTLNRDFLWGFDKYYNSKEENFQPFIKPYTFQDVKQIRDSTASFPRLLAGTKAEERDKKAKGQIELYPIIAAEGGYDMSSPARFTNNLAIGGNLLMFYKDKFALNFKAVAGNEVFNSYQDSTVKQMHVVPGIGYAYKSNNDTFSTRYAYQYYSGYVSYAPNKIFNFQIGRDKHFWGDGYRSLFLSDVSAPYPFLKITTRIWHLTYVNLYTIMKDATPSGFKKDWLTKYATFHYLGWNATKRINIGLFESIVWQGSDNNRHRGYDINYLNPVMFYRPTEYSLGSSDNAFVGASFKIKIAKNLQLYGQALLDEFVLKEVRRDFKHAVGTADSAALWGWWANKQAYQGGFKWFDLFTVKRLNFQTEVNYVRPYTYAHGSVQQNYSNMNQPLAHPLGANFMESATFINYRYKRLFIEAKYIHARYGADSAGTDYGKNIFISYVNHPNEYGNFTGQGFQTRLTTISLRAAYMLDTRMAAKIELGFADRIIKTAYTSKQIPYVFFGIKMDLSNLYSDY